MKKIETRHKVNENHKDAMLECAHGILGSDGMQMELGLPHHNINAYEHSVGVAYMSFRIVSALNLKVDARSLLRGALLHDYYLYNCHERELHPKHLVEHPSIALEQAAAEYNLNELEQDIILHHMFPVTPEPPKHKEAILVCIADKICACYEVLAGLPMQAKYRRRMAAIA